MDFFFFPLMEFPINFKTTTEAHRVPIPIPDTATATKNLAI